MVQSVAFVGARDQDIAAIVELKLSRAVSVLLFIIYVISIGAQIYAAAMVDKNASTLGTEDVERSSVAHAADAGRSDFAIRDRDSDLLSSKLLLSDRVKLLLTLLMLGVSAAFASLCADNLVSAVEHVLDHTSLTETFLGLILFPLLGNTTELGTAVSVAMRNQIDLAINVSIASAAQIALFMAPILVILAWMAQAPLTLAFHPFEAIALVVSMMAVMPVIMLTSGQYWGGMVLCCLYGALWFVLVDTKSIVFGC